MTSLTALNAPNCFDRPAASIAAAATALPRVDALVFTGGIGEHAAPVRERICEGLGHLGAFQVHVFPADEERVIARHVGRVDQPADGAVDDPDPDDQQRQPVDLSREDLDALRHRVARYGHTYAAALLDTPAWPKRS